MLNYAMATFLENITKIIRLLHGCHDCDHRCNWRKFVNEIVLLLLMMFDGWIRKWGRAVGWVFYECLAYFIGFIIIWENCDR